MPKQKTHKGVSKRFRVTGTGKVKFRHSGTSHLSWRITTKRSRQLRGTGVLSATETKRILQGLPNE